MSSNLSLPTFETCNKDLLVARCFQPTTVRARIDALLRSEGRAKPAPSSVTKCAEPNIEDFSSPVWSKGAMLVSWPNLLADDIWLLGLFAINMNVSSQALAADPLKGAYFRLHTGDDEDLLRGLIKDGLMADLTTFFADVQVWHRTMEAKSWFDRIVGLILPAAAKKYKEEKAGEAEAPAEKSMRAE